MSAALIEKRPCIRIGRERTQHLSRIVLADDGEQWELHTWCGHNLEDTEFTATFTVPTCEDCLAARDAKKEDAS